MLSSTTYALAVDKLAAFGAASKGPDTGFNPFGLIAIAVAVIALIILLITFRRR